MNLFLGFNLFYEQTKDGLWRGYASNPEVRTPIQTNLSLSGLYKSFQYDILKHHCRSDMGASYIVDSQWVLLFCNLPAMSLHNSIQMADVDYSKPGTVIAKTKFDSKEAQLRVNVRAFEHYSLCKVFGVFTEPNLLAIG